MRRLYLASPYSHKSAFVRLDRFNAVCLVAGDLMNHGYIVFSPIAHSHPIALQCDLPLGWEFWQKFDHAFIEWADAVVVAMIPGWQESKGVAAEIAIAQEMGKEVIYLEVEP